MTCLRTMIAGSLMAAAVSAGPVFAQADEDAAPAPFPGAEAQQEMRQPLSGAAVLQLFDLKDHVMQVRGDRSQHAQA